MVRKPMEDKVVRITIKALVVINVHPRDVLRDLGDKGNQNAADFDWTAQLRDTTGRSSRARRTFLSSRWSPLRIKMCTNI